MCGTPHRSTTISAGAASPATDRASRFTALDGSAAAPSVAPTAISAAPAARSIARRIFTPPFLYGRV